MKRAFALTVSVLFLLAGRLAAQTATPTPPPLGGFVDDSSIPIQYVNSTACNPTPCAWQIGSAAAAYLGSYHYLTPGNGRFQFNFIGTGAAVYGYRASNGEPDGEFCISGHGCVVANYYNATTQWGQKIAEIDGLPLGLHSAYVRGHGDGYINIDAIAILQDTTPPATPFLELIVYQVFAETTPEPTPAWRAGYEINGQAVAVDYLANSGQVAGIVFKAAILFTVCVLAVVLMRGGAL